MRATTLAALLVLAFFGCIASNQARTDTTVEIVMNGGTAEEAAGKEQLERLLRTYDLDPWIHTRRVVIESYAIPHSHPVLTLNTNSLDDDESQLSTFVHEQSHWFVSGRDRAEAEVVAGLRQRYPTVPVGRPDGARDEHSTYVHLIVCWLELNAMSELIGEEPARSLLAQKPYYRWVYERVLSDTEEIGELLTEHDLLIRSGG